MPFTTTPSTDDSVLLTRATGRAVCPECGRDSDGVRRFCARCGHQFGVRPGTDRAVRTPSRWRRWWAGLRDPHDRAARREYRRALPLVYRWRRVVVALLLLAGVVGASYVVDGDPRGWARDRWSDVFYRDRLVVVLPSGVSVEPPKATAKGKPDMLVDNDGDAWTMRWREGDGGCLNPRSAVITLRFEPAVRVRQILIYPGLQEAKSRAEEFQPAAIGIGFDAQDPCAEANRRSLEDEVGPQSIGADSDRPVTTVRVVVLAAHPRADAPKAQRLSITDLQVLIRQQ
jgi:hypothetical protein